MGGIQAVASTQVTEVDEVTNRSLEEQNVLALVGETWLRQQIRHTNQLHYVRLFILGLLLVLILLWLASIPLLLLLVGTHPYGFTLSDAVVMTYMGATTVSVLGLVRIAARWCSLVAFPIWPIRSKNSCTKTD